MLPPKFKVEVGPYKTKYQVCATVPKRTWREYSDYNIICQPSLKARAVKITTLEEGSLALCQVAVYGKHGELLLH